ncbi:helix-turn-helix domain-containing protein [Amycolatopsis rhabdoformis]|uniref:Helix-turn-helix domain-containing protein n=1 Tax=Amycolatopsis rhabdoformis TaxID=1448059 RepID=A0ABZ1I5N9_9PSEU|nr:helix-turn-helix domain-containing protein [Amycolatopsis rhabdoformis]WSE28808.1 helix-turn-helix domain-containing protein [Amycolatopsis rhabdoformis]
MTERRLDARRNHERVLSAAEEAFAEHGLAATVPGIAERAGVGKATVYRNYPAKEDLVSAIADRWFAELEKQLPGSTQDPVRALHEAVVGLFAALARNRLLADLLAEGSASSSARLLDLLGKRVAAARDAGQLRTDASVTDVRVLLCGAVLQLIRLDVRDEAAWRRYGELVLNALRA